MKLPIKIYRYEEDQQLHFVESGECDVYAPEIIGDPKAILKPYVSLNFGKYRFHIDLKDFQRFCTEFLYNKTGSKSNGTLVLRPHIENV